MSNNHIYNYSLYVLQHFVCMIKMPQITITSPLLTSFQQENIGQIHLKQSIELIYSLMRAGVKKNLVSLYFFSPYDRLKSVIRPSKIISLVFVL